MSDELSTLAILTEMIARDGKISVWAFITHDDRNDIFNEEELFLHEQAALDAAARWLTKTLGRVVAATRDDVDEADLYASVTRLEVNASPGNTTVGNDEQHHTG